MASTGEAEAEDGAEAEAEAEAERLFQGMGPFQDFWVQAQPEGVLGARKVRSWQKSGNSLAVNSGEDSAEKVAQSFTIETLQNALAAQLDALKLLVEVQCLACVQWNMGRMD